MLPSKYQAMYKWISAFFIFTASAASAQTVVIFRSLNEVFVYADRHSYTFRNANEQSILAKYQIIAAQLNKWNLQGPSSLSLTDNAKLSTTFIPAEIFGGPSGTFRPVTFGQKYVSNLTVAPQIDLINPYTAALVKVSKTNERLTTITNLVDKKTLYENLAAAYYNILSYQSQESITRLSLANNDTLVTLLRLRVQLGQARSQDLNAAQANRLVVADKLQQLGVLLEQQVNSLKLVCDLPVSDSVVIQDNQRADNITTETADGNLLGMQADLNLRYRQAQLNADRRWVFPTVNLFSSFGWQQNTNDHFFDHSKWYGTNYVGLRLNIPLIPDANKIASVKNDRINLEIAKNNWQHNRLQDSINNSQLQLDYQKSFRSYRYDLEAEALRENTYRKNLNIYKEGILSATDLLNSLNDWLNASLNSASQLADSKYQKSRIIISNTIK